MGLLVVQVLIALLTLIALWPPRQPLVGAIASLPAMLTAELAPWVMAITGLDVALTLGLGGVSDLSTPTVIGLGLAVLNLIGQVALVRRAQTVAPAADRALAEGLGSVPTPVPGDRSRVRALWSPFGLSSPAVSVDRDIAYGDAPKKRNLLDVYRPADAPALGGAPVLIQVHGGTWMYGHKAQQGRVLMNRMAENGWICVAINYRLSPANTWPAHIVDVKKAIAWVKENIATYGGDPEHVVITGGSAGGHLAALAATTPNDPAFQPGFEATDTSVVGAVPLYGVFDIAGVSDVASAAGLRDFMAKRIFKVDPVAGHDALVAASPLARVTESTPDFFVLHGTSDSTADINQSRAMVQTLRATSAASVTYLEVPGAQHAFDSFPSIRTLSVVDAIAQWLVHQHAKS